MEFIDLKSAVRIFCSSKTTLRSLVRNWSITELQTFKKREILFKPEDLKNLLKCKAVSARQQSSSMNQVSF